MGLRFNHDICGVFSAAAFFAVLLGTTADASCSITGSTATCTGVLTATAYSFETDGVDEIDINNLTININAPGVTAIDLTSTGADGADDASDNNGGPGTAGSDLTIDAEFGSQTISESDTAISVISTGGSGGAGKNINGAGTAIGGAGGSGAAGGVIVISASGTGSLMADQFGIQAQSTGGAGGVGGTGEPKGGDDGNYAGGAAGGGGNGGDITVQLSDSQTVTVTGATSGFDLRSLGDDGGTGGAASVGDLDEGSATGGNGGKGGDGGAVTLIANAAENSIAVTGTGNPGIFVESIGGNGGDGGKASGSGEVTKKDGNGGAGGTGGDLVAVVDASIGVSSEQAQGLYARSLGGSGGTGDTAGDGGNGGAVNVFFEGDITSVGNESNGILTQSVGGFAGDTAASGFVSWGTGETSNGTGGDVSVLLQSGSTISTNGSYASGIDAQSIGGGGGTGSTASDSFTTLGSAAGSVGGNGGDVTVSVVDATIETVGLRSQAVSATSVGGTGGNSGSETGVTAVGSTAGAGGNGGTVNVNLLGADLSTEGDHSSGVYGASIGGGGGNAYSTTGINQTGGNGGDGGTGGDVIVLGLGLDGEINTNNFDFSDAVHLQSVGGGGGNGANAISVTTSLTFSHAVGGGSGGAGGAGGDILFVDIGDSTIATGGLHSRGIVAQSIGGGGGNAGNDISTSVDLGLDLSTGNEAKSSGGDGSDGGDVGVLFGGELTTTGALSTGILAQSVGGSGGSGGTTIDITTGVVDFSTGHSHNVGSSGGDGGDGGDVAVVSTNLIDTVGDLSDGIQAQSIGGSGGSAGAVYSFNSAVSGTTSITFGYKDGETLDHNVGAGGAGGDADTVAVGNLGTIRTTGDGSSGIVAQSVAGGGGRGGQTLTVDVFDGGINNTIGSSGGSGGTSGNVAVVSTGTIIAKGSLSHGIVAQSLGGSGGNGGVTAAASTMTTAVNEAVGGSGGTGGNSGEVRVDNSGLILTTGAVAQSELTDAEVTGQSSSAIVAQSIAGGGGNGGMVFDIDASVSLAATVGIGASGGAGGDAGVVVVNNTGELGTLGTYSHGILAQSIGGTGGNGGTVFNATASVGEYTGNVAITLGGGGGDGGSGDVVIATNTNRIVTAGYASTGILAQSIGGSGGTGGAVVGASASASEEGSLEFSVTIGGDGGDGGSSDLVLVENQGDIITLGNFSDGIQAQSIAGNGGAGGSAYALVLDASTGDNLSASFTVGGNGGKGGAVAGDVVINNSGTILAEGGNSNGIYAQSIGGSGGDGGSSYTILSNWQDEQEDAFTGSVTATLGGTGGAGNHAGAVIVTNDGTITTTDGISRGIFAQSVGGGGGDGGSVGQYNIGYTSTEGEAEDDEWSFTFTMGGSGGAGGDGDTVIVNNTGDINTSGEASYGIFAQSVGGGGGNAADGTLLRGWTNDIYAIDQDIVAAQTIYQDLENPSNFIQDWSVTVGGDGGSGGVGGDVTVNNSGNITTTWRDATGVFMQSVGGGGGAGGDGSQGFGLSFAAGAASGDGGDGGDLFFNSDGGSITTSEARAMGIFAQTVGGSGGAAGDIEASFGVMTTEINLGSGAITGKQGVDGDGGDITIESVGNITTQGELAHGIFAQSVGGGGGGQGVMTLNANGTFNSFSGALGSGNGSGDGGAISIEATGDITANGDYAVGIIALSTGSSKKSTGDIAISVSSGSLEPTTIAANGTNGRAIFAHSDAGTTGTIDIEIDEGSTVSSSGGSEGFDTVTMIGGSTMTLTIDGTLENTSSDDASNVIYAGDGTSTITVNGVLTGSVDLSASDGSGTLTNNGAFDMGSTVDLGGGDSQFFAYGEMSPGGGGVVATTTITAANGLEMNSDGEYVVDVSLGSDPTDATSDLIIVTPSGSSGGATFNGGTITPNLIGTSLPSSGDTGTLTILEVTAEDGITENDALTITDTSTVDYSLSTSGDDNSSELILTYTVDYSGASSGVSLGENHSDFSDQLSDVAGVTESLLADGTPERQAVQDLIYSVLNAQSGEELKSIYDEHVIDEAAAGVKGSLYSAYHLHGLLQSCPQLSRTPADGFNRQQDCNWAQTFGYFIHEDETGGNTGYEETSAGLAAGLQRELMDGLFLELAGHGEWVTVDGSNFDQDGYRFGAGAALKQELGNVTLSATASGGFYRYDYSRTYSDAFVASSNPQGRYIAGEARITGLFTNDQLYAKPGVAITATHTWQDAFTETGAGLLDQRVDAISHTSMALRPMVEVGAGFDIMDKAAIAYLRGGATVFLTGDDIDVTSGFADLGDGFADFTTTLSHDQVYGELEAGLNVSLSDRMSLGLKTRGTLSENSYSVGGQGRLRWQF